jgi:hypothetical protein
MLELNKGWMVVCTAISYREKQIDDVASKYQDHPNADRCHVYGGQDAGTIEKLLELRKDNVVGKRKEVTEGKLKLHLAA